MSGIPNEIIKEIIQAAPMATFRLFMLANKEFCAFCKSILASKMKGWEITQTDDEGNRCISLPNGLKVYQESKCQSKKRYYEFGQWFLEIYHADREYTYVRQKKLNKELSFVIKRSHKGYKINYWLTLPGIEEYVYNNASGVTWSSDVSLEKIFLDNFDIYQYLDCFKCINLNIVVRNGFGDYDFEMEPERRGLTYFLKDNETGKSQNICKMKEEDWADIRSEISPEMFKFMKKQAARCCKPEIS